MLSANQLTQSSALIKIVHYQYGFSTAVLINSCCKKQTSLLPLFCCRFLEEYKKEGIPVWALSAGNEVMILMITRMQALLNFTLETAPIQRSFIKHNLKPLLQSNNFSDVKILTLDDERLFAPYWMDRVSSYSVLSILFILLFCYNFK